MGAVPIYLLFLIGSTEGCSGDIRLVRTILGLSIRFWIIGPDRTLNYRPPAPEVIVPLTLT